MNKNKANQITIAIAEDHQLMREGICHVLSGFGFNIIIQAKNGLELIEELEKLDSLPDVCLLDINMPVMNGIDAAKEISTHFPATKIAALSTNVDAESLAMMLRNGAGCYLVKSSDPSEWEVAINGLVNRGYYQTEWMTAMLPYIQQE